MNKEQKIWLSISVISGIIFMVIMTMIVIYDKRLDYDLYKLISVYIIMFASFLMYAFTQYSYIDIDKKITRIK